jgi:phospholipid/cholesterol/gamma-HCH transport system substrate-binding protein
MSPKPGRDFVVGLFVLTGLCAVGWLSLRVGGLSYTGPLGFEVTATFDEIGGLRDRAPVMVSGVKVGQVRSIGLDEAMRARVVLDLDPRLKLPVDTSAAVRTAGLLGDQFVALMPGAEEETIAPGEAIDRTESALSLESLIGKFVVSSGDGEEKPR